MCIESCYILTHNINVLLLVNRSYNFNCSVQSIFKPAVLVIIVDTASIVCGAGSMKLSSVRLSVCLSHHLTATRRCSGFAALGPAARRYRSIAARPAPSSKREQRQFVS